MSETSHIDPVKINALVQYEDKNENFYQLDESEIQTIRDHLISCKNCQVLYQDSTKIYHGIKQELAQKHPSKKIWYGIAASIILLISAYQFGLFDSDIPDEMISAKDQSTEVTQPNTSPTTEDEKTEDVPQDKDNSVSNLLAANIEPNAELEYMVDNNLRSTSLTDVGSTLIDGNHLQITWTYAGSEDLTIRLVDNKEKEIIQHDKVTPPLKIAIPYSGLFYWILETEDEILYTGKTLHQPE
ncbi:MAG: hypothetical protein RIM99_09940 [Cyclobacteriaceae bacterium]